MKKIAIILGLLLYAQPALAQVPMGNDNQPIEITADQLEVVQPNRKAVFRGNVVAVQGNVSLRASTMTVYYRTANERSGTMGAIAKIEVNKNVVLATPDETAQAEQGIYHVDFKQIQLVGNVVLTRGQNVLKGGRLDYDMRTQKSLLSASVPSNAPGFSGGGGRVKGVFLPTQ
jgi:lipopolysaccharide export system protein LptA